MHPAQSLRKTICGIHEVFTMSCLSLEWPIQYVAASAQYGGEVSDSCAHDSVKATAGWSCQSGPLHSKMVDVVCSMHGQCRIRDVAIFKMGISCAERINNSRQNGGHASDVSEVESHAVCEMIEDTGICVNVCTINASCVMALSQSPCSFEC